MKILCKKFFNHTNWNFSLNIIFRMFHILIIRRYGGAEISLFKAEGARAVLLLGGKSILIPPVPS